MVTGESIFNGLTLIFAPKRFFSILEKFALTEYFRPQIFSLEAWYLQHCLLHLTLTYFLESCLDNPIRCERLHYNLQLKIFGIKQVLDFSNALAIIVFCLISKEYDLQWQRLLKIVVSCLLGKKCWMIVQIKMCFASFLLPCENSGNIGGNVISFEF